MRDAGQFLDAIGDSESSRRYVTGNGEILWTRARAPFVAHALADAGFAIIGLEAYVRGRGARASFLADWSIRQHPGEPWAVSVSRSLEEALGVMALGREDRAPVHENPSGDEEVVYFIAAVDGPG